MSPIRVVMMLAVINEMEGQHIQIRREGTKKAGHHEKLGVPGATSPDAPHQLRRQLSQWQMANNHWSSPSRYLRSSSPGDVLFAGPCEPPGAGARSGGGGLGGEIPPVAWLCDVIL